ncbi:MAG: DegT/DnrJ/EryC1/StrS family aminotransferase [Pirellulales bacterium]
MGNTPAEKPCNSRPQPISAVPLLDMRRQYEALREAITGAVNRVCESGRFILGPDCEELERGIAAYCGVPHAIGCASGSDALLLALMAIGVGVGDEVIVPSYTFFATASAVTRLGAKPVFVDIDPATFNIDPALIEARLTNATKAIIPVHLFGQCAEMDVIGRIAKARGLVVIEDAAQAIGAEYHGRRAGSIGDIGCFSFYPTKNLGGCGDGGMLTTNRQDLADALRLLRVHGMQPRYYHQVVGINSRLDSLQAAVLNVKLPHLDRWTELRQANATRYTELFRAAGLDRVLGLPAAAPGLRHVWNQYVIRVPDGKRDPLRQHLTTEHIGTEIYYPVPLDEQECFKKLGFGPDDLPETARAARETLAMPIFAELTADEQATVVSKIAAFFGRSLPPTGSSLSGPKFLKFSDRANARK